MFTTPAIASEPYTDDAPPVMTSSFSIKSVGIELRSTYPSPGCPPTHLLPLTRVRVLPEPKPLKLTV